MSPWLRLTYFLMTLPVVAVAAWLAFDPASDDLLRWGAGAVGVSALAMLVRIRFIGVSFQDGTLLVRNPLWTHRVPAQKIDRIAIVAYDGYWAPESFLGFLNPFNYADSPVAVMSDEVTIDHGDGTPPAQAAAFLELTCLAGWSRGAARRADRLVAALGAQGWKVGRPEQPVIDQATFIDWSIGPLPPRAVRNDVPGQPRWRRPRRDTSRRAVPASLPQPRPVRFGEWLGLFIVGRGGGLLSGPVICLILGVVVGIPWGMAERQAHLTGLELAQVGQTSVVTSCDAKYLRLSEAAVRVAIPNVPDLVTLAYPSIGPVIGLIPFMWEQCRHEYEPPFDVVFHTRPDGQVIAVAAADLPELLSPALGDIILGVGVVLVSAAPVWAVWAWLLLRRPEPS